MTRESRFPSAQLVQIPRRLAVLVGWLVEREHLPHIPSAATSASVGRRVFAWLAAPDPLPGGAVPSPPQPGFFSWLAARERIPSLEEVRPLRTRASRFWPAAKDRLPRQAAISGRSRTSPLWLLLSEPLPTADPRRPTPSRSLLRWLLTSEPEQRLNGLESIKEVPPNEP